MFASTLPAPSTADAPACDPLDASYILGGRVVRLERGSAETLPVTGSTARERTWVVGEPVSGDLDGDGDEDSAMILAQDSGGSGTFYYVVAAREQRGACLGSHGVLLGDRIRIEGISVVHGLVIVRSLRRGAGEPMASIPTIATTAVLRIEQGKLAALGTLEAGEQLLAGRVTIGHEVRSFVPCGQNRAHWIVGNSAALDEILAGYREAAVNAKPYASLFMVGAGRVTAPPVEGFGVDYADAVEVDHLFLLQSGPDCLK